MDQQNQTGPQGPAGRRLHIAHRRSPSEMTPLMGMYLVFLSLRILVMSHFQCLQMLTTSRSGATPARSAD
jgi:hypothetical protein